MLQKDNNLLAAILYSDIFDYPLTKEEVKKYQIANNALKIKGKVVNKNGFYYLQGRGKIIQERLQRVRGTNPPPSPSYGGEIAFFYPLPGRGRRGGFLSHLAKTLSPIYLPVENFDTYYFL